VTSKKYLVFVDDEEDLHEVIKFYFKKEVKADLFQTAHFLNGKECLGFLEEKASMVEVILIVSDINMPVMDGITLLENVKKLYPHIEVHMVTAYGDDEYVNGAKEFGADGYHIKPLDFSRFRENVLKKLGGD
jgi:two-component system, response regulator, stage 0 sporulation protein F